MNEQWLEGLRAEYRYNLLYADLNARIRDLRAAMARRHAWCSWLLVALAMAGSFAVGVALALWLC